MADTRPTLMRFDRPAIRRAVGASILALLIALGVQITFAFEDKRAEDDRRAAVEVAERVAVGLTSFRSSGRRDALQALQRDLTGRLQKQFASERTLLDTILKDSAVTSTSSVDLSGVEAMGEDTCRVLVAVTSRAKNRDSPKGETRRYRMRLTLAASDGTWRARELEMVP